MGSGPLLVSPGDLSGLHRNGVDGTQLVGAGGDLVIHGESVEGETFLQAGRHLRAGVAQGEEHVAGQRAVGAGLPILAAEIARTDEDGLAELGEHRLDILGHLSGGAVDVADHVLRHGGGGPEKLPGLAVEGVDHAGLAWNPGHHLAHLSRLETGIDPPHLARVGRDRGVDQDALEGVVEIPVVDEMLVVPGDLAGGHLERQGGVVVEVLVLRAAEEELRRRRGHRRSDVEELEGGIVARHHPGADVLAIREGHLTPALVSRLAGRGNGAPTPQLSAAVRIVGGDDTRLRPGAGPATAPGDHLAVGDDGTGALDRRMRPIVKDLRVPDQLARSRVEGEDMVVVAGIDNQPAVDGQITVVGAEAADVAGNVVGKVAAMLPDEVAAHRIDRLNDILRVGQVQHSVVDQWSRLLATLAHAT